MIIDLVIKMTITGIFTYEVWKWSNIKKDGKLEKVASSTAKTAEKSGSKVAKRPK